VANIWFNFPRLTTPTSDSTTFQAWKIWILNYMTFQDLCASWITIWWQWWMMTMTYHHGRSFAATWQTDSPRSACECCRSNWTWRGATTRLPGDTWRKTSLHKLHSLQHQITSASFINVFQPEGRITHSFIYRVRPIPEFTDTTDSDTQQACSRPSDNDVTRQAEINEHGLLSSWLCRAAAIQPPHSNNRMPHVDC